MGFVVKVHPKTYKENKTNWIGYLSQQLGKSPYLGDLYVQEDVGMELGCVKLVYLESEGVFDPKSEAYRRYGES